MIPSVSVNDRFRSLCVNFFDDWNVSISSSSSLYNFSYCLCQLEINFEIPCNIQLLETSFTSLLWNIVRYGPSMMTSVHVLVISLRVLRTYFCYLLGDDIWILRVLNSWCLEDSCLSRQTSVINVTLLCVFLSMSPYAELENTITKHTTWSSTTFSPVIDVTRCFAIRSCNT